MRIFTRSGLDWTDKFPGIANAAARLTGTALIDGEAVAFKDGRPDFSTLKNAIGAGGDIVLMAFDLLEQDGTDLTAFFHAGAKGTAALAPGGSTGWHPLFGTCDRSGGSTVGSDVP